MLLQKLSPAGCTLLSSSDDSLVEHWPTVHPSSQASRFHDKGVGNHELYELVNEARLHPISIPPPPASVASTQRYSWGKRALSLDSPSPSPLHQVVLAGKKFYKSLLAEGAAFDSRLSPPRPFS